MPASNTDGSITSTVKTNGDFSIITYTGTGSSATVGHGLNGTADFVITKNRDSTGQWITQHSELTGGTYWLLLNSTSSETNDSSVVPSAPTSSVFSVGTDGNINTSGDDYIAYAWRNVTGKQKFGTYTGDGTTDGSNEVTLGFRAGWLMIKHTGGTQDWHIYDGSRNPFTTGNEKYLYANGNNAEASAEKLEFTDTGFKLKVADNAHNGNGNTYIYAAFAGSYSDFITDYNTDGTNMTAG